MAGADRYPTSMPYLFAVLFPACAPLTQPVASPTAETPAPVQELPFEEQLTGGASTDATLPLVVTLHGRGSDPVRFQKFFAKLDAPLRIVHLEAPVEEHDGRAWFSFRGKTRATLQAEVDALADRAVATTRALSASRPTVGKPVVVGFSQGSIVVYAMVLRHPEVFEKALPIAGGMMTQMPADVHDGEVQMPKVIAMHGQRDPVMYPGMSAEAAAALEQLGFPAEVRFFPENVHWIDGELELALHQELTPSSKL